MMNLSPTEGDVLVGLLILGDSIPLGIAEWSGAHPKSVNRSVSDLLDRGLIVRKHRAAYGLTPEGYAAARSELKRRAEDQGD